MARALQFWMRAFDSRPACIALLLLSVSAVYANALGASFQFDDFNVIVDYAAVHSLRAWFDALPGIRPLLKLSYTLNWIIDTRPFGFHLFNLLCHLISATLVFQLARRLFQASSHVHAMALLAALLFALHPAQTETVTYISGRSVALMSVFYLGALLAALHQRVYVRDWLAPLLLLAALLTKETAWTLPAAAVLVYGLRGETLRASLRRTRILWIALLAAAVVIVAIPAYRRLLRHVFSIRPLVDNLALQVDGWWYLLTRPLLLQTNIDPDLPLTPAYDFVWWLQLAVLLACVICVWRSRSGWLRFAVLWFGLHLLPTNSILPRNDIANDRQLYLALIGPALAIVWFAMMRPLWLRTALTIALLGLCGAATLQRNRDYRDEISLWQATATVSPRKARIWNNLGYAYESAGRRAEALAAYEMAMRLEPDFNRARVNWLLLRDSIQSADP